MKMAGKLFNVLYFIVDDLRPEFMAAYGQSQMLTPNVDKLAEAGTVFRNAHCQQAVCGPSRASFMTGRRPQHTQVYGNSACFRDIGVARDGSAGKGRRNGSEGKGGGGEAQRGCAGAASHRTVGTLNGRVWPLGRGR